MSGTLHCLIEQGIATLRLSHPHRRNALNQAMWQALTAHLRALDADPEVRVVLLEGADGHFAAGADISEFTQVRRDAAQARRFHEHCVGPALTALRTCRHPVIASIDGSCTGGGLELACAADLRVASRTARLGIPIQRLGFALAPQEARALLQLFGPADLLAMLLEGRLYSAEEAYARGWLHHLTDGPARPRALEVAARIARGAPLAVRTHKWLVHALNTDSHDNDAALAERVFALTDTDDYREGIASFLEGRPPHFTGR